MPELRETTVNDDELRDRDWEKKIKAKTYADERRGAQPNYLQTGDQVLLKKKKSDKLSAKFESEPYEIVEKKGNSVVIQSPEKVQYQRNVTEVKKFTPREEQSANSDRQLELLEDNELEQRPQRDRRPPDRYGEWEQPRKKTDIVLTFQGIERLCLFVCFFFFKKKKETMKIRTLAV